MIAKCSRCHKNEVKRPARICQTCHHAPKRRRTSRATARPGGGRAAGVIARSTSSFPVASAAYYEDAQEQTA